MRFLFKVVVFLFFSLTVFAQETIKEKKIVIIDPGHGGYDSGAVGINGILEKDIVLKIALETVALNLISKDSNLDIYLTRYTDTLISLKDRFILTKVLKADVFISLHCNYSENPNARGMELYLSTRTNFFSLESLVLANDMEKEFRNSIGFESRGIKFSDFQVIKSASTICKSILFELGFLSNSDEANYLDKNIKIIASSLWKTINENLGL